MAAPKRGHAFQPIDNFFLPRIHHHHLHEALWFVGSEAFVNEERPSLY
jgi:hypothetical protein